MVGQGADKPEAGPGKKVKEKPGSQLERPETGFAAVPARKYEVQPNDSWYRIALAEYGDAGLCQKLQAYNKKEDASLRVGAVVLLPTKETLTGKPEDPEKVGGKAPPEGSSIVQIPGKAGPKSKEKPAAPAPMYATYTVKRGDDLSKIAQSQLGSARRYHEILDLNRDVIDDEESIRPGVTLKMPAK
jgi:nucleoid-associated protein YgaU